MHYMHAHNPTMQFSKDITLAKPTGIRETPEQPEGVCQVFFRIPVELDVRIRHAMAEKRCSKRTLWLQAIESWLNILDANSAPAGNAREAIALLRLKDEKGAR